MSHGACSYICMHISAVSNSVMLQLCLYDCNNIIFKIKHVLYTACFNIVSPIKNSGCVLFTQVNKVTILAQQVCRQITKCVSVSDRCLGSWGGCDVTLTSVPSASACSSRPLCLNFMQPMCITEAVILYTLSFSS
jgi:hypothetical protein